jgi:hypothetical protein
MSGAALSLSISGLPSQAASRADDFVSIERHGVAWTIRADVVDELLPALGAAIAGAPANGWAEVVKAGPHRTVSRLSLAGGEVYLKHFRVPDAEALLQNVVRPCKAEREWRAANKIARCGLPTFEPVARCGSAR